MQQCKMNSYFLEKGLNKFPCLKSGRYESTRQTYLLINKLQVYSRSRYVSHITTVKKLRQRTYKLRRKTEQACLPTLSPTNLLK